MPNFNFGSLKNKDTEEIEKPVIKKKSKIKESENTSEKESGVPRMPRVSKTVKLVVPEHIKILFDSLDKSISTVWGIQKDGKIKWDAKYNMWLAFKEYFKELKK